MDTCKERLIKVLNREKVDRPPCICPGGMMNMVVEDVMDIKGISWPDAHFSPNQMAELTYGVYENGGFENCGVPFCMTIEAESMGARVDFGTKVTEPRVNFYPMNCIEDYKKLKEMDVSTGRAKVVLDAIRYLKDKDENVPVIANVVGPISVATSLIEPTIFYKALTKNKKTVHEFLEFVTDGILEFARAQIDAGADLIAIADPSATGEILGPKKFDEFVVPYINRILDKLNEDNKVLSIVHICGRLKSIYPQLNKINSSSISFDSITDEKQVIQNVSDKAIMGNVSTYALEYGTNEKVKAIGKNCIKNGVDILSPACGIGARTSIKNIQAMVNGAKETDA